jgi:alkanesulfonate monooxygenase SsuD/methylene tetrahydromethanopterin reductase-like flavin-dependent oxidoreductase (luciferase family)
VAWESASLDMLSGSRFELGLGASRPAARDDAARLGVSFGDPGERVQQLAHAIRAVKKLRDRPDGFSLVRPVQQPHPPILVAGRGARVTRLAAREADIVALGLPPHSPEEQLAAQLAGVRFDDIEVALHVAAVAGDLADLPGDGWLARQVGGDPRVMAALGGVAFLVGKPAQVADVLRRRRDTLGISYITVSGMFVEQFARVVELLAGR